MTTHDRVHSLNIKYNKNQGEIELDVEKSCQHENVFACLKASKLRHFHVDEIFPNLILFRLGFYYILCSVYSDMVKNDNA